MYTNMASVSSMTEDKLELSAFYEDNRRKESGTANPL